MRGPFFRPSFGSFFGSFAAGNETIIAGEKGFGNSESRSRRFPRGFELSELDCSTTYGVGCPFSGISIDSAPCRDLVARPLTAMIVPFACLASLLRRRGKPVPNCIEPQHRVESRRASSSGCPFGDCVMFHVHLDKRQQDCIVLLDRPIQLRVCTIEMPFVGWVGSLARSRSPTQD